jgi:hypothetical protein
MKMVNYLKVHRTHVWNYHNKMPWYSNMLVKKENKPTFKYDIFNITQEPLQMPHNGITIKLINFNKRVL